MRTYQTRRKTRKFAPLHFKEQKKEKNTPYLQREKNNEIYAPYLLSKKIAPLFVEEKCARNKKRQVGAPPIKR